MHTQDEIRLVLETIWLKRLVSTTSQATHVLSVGDGVSVDLCINQSRVQREMWLNYKTTEYPGFQYTGGDVHVYTRSSQCTCM